MQASGSTSLRGLFAILVSILLLSFLWDWIYFSFVPVGEPSSDTAIVSYLRTLSNESSSDRLGRPVILAESNSRFHPMTRWWIDNLKKLDPPVTKYAIVALDPAEKDRLLALKQAVIYNKDLNMDYKKTTFRSVWYNRIVRYKWQIVVDVLRSGHTLLLTDVDIHWRQNPLVFLKDLPECDAYFAADMRTLPQNGSAFRLYPPFPGDGFSNWVNTGFMLLRPRPAVIALAKRVLMRPLKGKDDQYILNTHLEMLYQQNRRTSQRGHGPTTCGNYGDFTFHFLRPDLFPNKLLYNNYTICRNYYTLHFNFMGDLTEKINYMVSNGFMDKEYLASPSDPVT